MFTPTGQIVDIPQGGTPLDFAYSIHSEVGHRCRGAKVNGRIVNLTTVLETGDEVEILTTKESRPSRDWMNKNLGFIKSAGTRSKVRNWFNHQDFEQNLLDGKSIYDRMLSKFSIHNVDLKQLVAHFKRKDADQFFADIGRGLITSAQMLGFLQTEPERDPFRKIKKEAKAPHPKMRSVSTGSATCSPSLRAAASPCRAMRSSALLPSTVVSRFTSAAVPISCPCPKTSVSA